MRAWMQGIVGLGLVVLGGCPAEPVPPCTEFDEIYAFVDADGDGFGSAEPAGWVCALGPGQVDNQGDCDDSRESVRPDAPERCDGLDNDCDGRVDDSVPFVPYYPDADGDGYGVTSGAVSACESPGGDYVREGADCDDAAPAVNPRAIEVCNGGVDDDCDGAADDADDGVDPTTQVRYYSDGDGDGFGADEPSIDRCVAPLGPQVVLVGGDCQRALQPVRRRLRRPRRRRRSQRRPARPVRVLCRPRQ